MDEVIDFLFRDRRLRSPIPLTEAMGQPEPEKEYVLNLRARRPARARTHRPLDPPAALPSAAENLPHLVVSDP